MSSLKISALKYELTVDLKQHIVDPDELAVKLKKLLTLAVIQDTVKKLGELSARYSYGYADKIETEVTMTQARRACDDFIGFVDDVRHGDILKLTAGTPEVDAADDFLDDVVASDNPSIFGSDE